MIFIALLTMAAAWPPDPTLVRQPEEIIVPQDAATQSALRQAHPGLRAFLRSRAGWTASIDPLTGSVERAAGDGIPRAELDLSGMIAPGLDQDGSSLVLDVSSEKPLADPAKKVVRYDLFQDGIPVLGAGLSLASQDDRVVMVTSRALARVGTSSTPALTATEALAAAAAHAGMPGLLAMPRQPSLAFLPRVTGGPGAQALKHHLIWVLELKPPEAPVWQGYIAWVDAHDGEILAFFPEAQNAECTADPAQVHGTVVGGVRPNRGDDPEVLMQLPFARVNQSGTITDADLNGRYPFSLGPAQSTLSGRYFRIHCDNCTLPSQPAAPADAAGRISFGTGGASSFPPVFGNGTSTPADRSAYFHLNESRRLLEKWGNANTDEIDVFVNLGDVCNAFSQSYLLGFFTGGGGCRNSGEIRDVMQHEFGHTWDRFDGTRITSGAMSEWKADTIAMLMGGDPCVGESFFFSGGPSSVCSGIRDLNEKSPGRTDHPATPGVCPTCATLTRSSNDCGGSSHCLGEISGQATWHLYNNLVTGRDYITNALMPGTNPALTPEQTRWLMERLFIGGGPPMITWDPQAAGMSSYDAIMFMDDNDGNLANGTPHAAYINAAYAHHGIAENTQISDSANCVDPADPVATATLERDAATGLPRAVIDWTPVGGATSFDVYRNTRAGDGFLPLAQNLTTGPVTDPGIQPGQTYRYFVAAVNRTGCAGISPGNNIVTITAGDPELGVNTLSVSEAPGGGDGDGRVEPGERARVQISLRETAGLTAATMVTASLTASDPSVSVVAGGPASLGTIPAGSTSAGSALFEVFLGPSLPVGGTARAVLGSSSEEGCWQEGVGIPLDATAGAAPTATAFVQVVAGSVIVLSGGGDADGTADNCETTTLRYTVTNSGTNASGPVTVVASSTHPGITFPGSPTCSLTSLAGSASAFCQLTFSLGSASNSGVALALTASAANSPAPSTLAFTLGAESDPPVFATQSYGFEGSLEGWTAQQFAVSSARSFAGSTSVHSGSVSLNNLCGKLTSPGFLINASGGSTMAFRLWADIEPLTDQWYDRANVHIVDIDTGVETLVTPASGPAYNASGNPQGGICHIPGEAGWGANLGGFTQVTFNLGAFQGRRIQVQVNYNTDEGDDREGIYIDALSITNAALLPLPADSQADTCTVPEVSPALAPVGLGVAQLPGNMYRFDWQDTGAAFAYNLYAGTIGTYYDHGGTALTCASGNAGVSCDGTRCQVDHAVTGSRYFLVTATGFGQEGTSGFASAGVERPAGQSSCQP